MKEVLKIAAVLFLVTMIPMASISAKDRIQTGFLSNTALDGYDSVAYFTLGQPVKGEKQFHYKYLDADWFFSSQENLDKFKTKPEKYAPQYGGYCAWAVSQGYTAKGDPNHWSVHNDKLYLNYNDSIQAKWFDKKDYFIAKGDENWPKVLD